MYRYSKIGGTMKNVRTNFLSPKVRCRARRAQFISAPQRLRAAENYSTHLARSGCEINAARTCARNRRNERIGRPREFRWSSFPCQLHGIENSIAGFGKSRSNSSTIRAVLLGDTLPRGDANNFNFPRRRATNTINFTPLGGKGKQLFRHG